MKKRKKQYLIFLIGIFFVATLGCHTSKKVTENKRNSVNMSWSGEKIIDSIKKHQIDFNTLSARLHIDYKDGKKQFNNVTTYIRMKEDSAIWLSIRPLLGIEMMRILITPDSIKLHNNVKNKRIVRSIKDVTEVLHIPFDFSVIQSLIIGNMPLIPARIKNFKADSAVVSFEQKEGMFKSTYKWSAHPFLLQRSQYHQLKGSKYAEQQYADYESFSVGEVSIERNIRIEGASRKNLHFKFDKIKFNTPVSFPFP